MLDLFRSRTGIAFVLIALVLLGIVLRVTGRMGLVEDTTHGVFTPVQVLIWRWETASVTYLVVSATSINSARRSNSCKSN